MGAIIFGDGFDTLDATCPVLRTSISVSLQPLQGVMISLLWDIARLTVIKQ